jgi:hypothetical protein
MRYLQYLVILLSLIVPAQAFTISGTVNFTDVNNLTTTLPYARVELNSTVNTTTDITGAYNFTDMSPGTYMLRTLKNNAYSIESNTIIFDNTSDIISDFTLSFSKPYMDKPYILGNYIKGVYSNNIHTMNLWQNPNYMFGIYILQNSTYYKQCTLDSGNTFSCDRIINQNYTFHFMFSDIYNSNLTMYHPTLTGARNFTSEDLVVTAEASASSGKLSKNTQREAVLKDDFFTYLTVLIAIILLVFVASLFEFEKVEEVYKKK